MDSRHHRWNDSGPSNGNVRERDYSSHGTRRNGSGSRTHPIPFGNANASGGNLGSHHQNSYPFNRQTYNQNQSFPGDRERQFVNRRPDRGPPPRRGSGNSESSPQNSPYTSIHSNSPRFRQGSQPEAVPIVVHIPYTQFMQTKELLAALEADAECGSGDHGDPNNNPVGPSRSYSPPKPKFAVYYQLLEQKHSQGFTPWEPPTYNPVHDSHSISHNFGIPVSSNRSKIVVPSTPRYNYYYQSGNSWKGCNYLEQTSGPTQSPIWTPNSHAWHGSTTNQPIPSVSQSSPDTGYFTPRPIPGRGFTMKPQGVVHNWDIRRLTANEISSRAYEVTGQIKSLFDMAANAQEVSFEAILKPLLEAHRYSFLMGSICTFPRHVHGDQKIRNASADATKILDDASVEMGMRIDVYQKLVEYQEKGTDLGSLRPEYLRALDRFVQHGRRNGLHLPEDTRNEIKRIKKRISELTLQFSRNLAEDNTTILFIPEELSGLPYSFFDGLEKDITTGKLKVTLKYPHFFPVTRKCHNPKTRKTIETAYQSKCQQENTPILEEILELRHREAVLLGFPNHASLSQVQDALMAKSPEAVQDFLNDLTDKLKPLWNKEKELMLELKKKDCEKHGYEFDGTLEFWDFRYYMCLIEEESYTVDQELIMEYFPLDVVISGMLSIYQDLFCLQFAYLPYADKWHVDVLVYQVCDRDSKELLGYIYLDLYPRPGKFGHACCIPLQPGCLDSDGIKQPAISAMLTNFNRPKDGKPSLLDHREVETFFHEFGHLIHTVCSKAITAVFFGTRVETDFVEAPSQMLENWVWEKEPLQRMSAHWQTQAPLPDELIDRLSNSRNACAGALNLRQLVLARFDQEIHIRGGRINTQEVYAQILKEIMDFDAIPGTNMPANFNHLCVGYSGRYYSYLWSEVYSQDMFRSMFKPNGVFNSVIGRRYRECILEPGGSVDAIDMLRNFLGREPVLDSFLEAKGLQSPGGTSD